MAIERSERAERSLLVRSDRCDTGKVTDELLFPALRRRAEGGGAAGERWVAELPARLADLERRWSVTVRAPLQGGNWAFVAAAETLDGRPVVLKLPLPNAPGPGPEAQVDVLTSADGVGYVRLLAWDPDPAALLLEALGPPLATLGLPVETQIETLCMTLRDAWQVPVPEEVSTEMARAKADELGELVVGLWEQLDRPCPRRVVDLALTYAGRRGDATRLDDIVVAHGDPHPDNALRAAVGRSPSGYLFIDPDGFVADPAYDLGVVVRDWCGELLTADVPQARAVQLCRLAAEHGARDEQAVWEWGYLERTSSGLFLLAHGMASGRTFLETAARLAG